jgi:hypothetical protein
LVIVIKRKIIVVSISPTNNNIVYNNEIAQSPAALPVELCPDGNCEIRVGPPADYPKLNPKRGSSLSVKADWQPDLGRPANRDLRPITITSDMNTKTTVNPLDNSQRVGFKAPDSKWDVTFTQAQIPFDNLDQSRAAFNPITNFTATDGSSTITGSGGSFNLSTPLKLGSIPTTFNLGGQNSNFQAGISVPFKFGGDIDIKLNLNTSSSPLNFEASVNVAINVPVIGDVNKVGYNSATGGITFGFAAPPSGVQNNGSSVEADKNTGISIFGGSVTTEFRGFNDARFGITWPR